MYRRQMRAFTLLAIPPLVALACGSPREHEKESAPVVDDRRPERDSWRAFVGPRFLANGEDQREYEGVVVDASGRIISLHETRESLPEVEHITLPGVVALPGLHDAHLHVEGIGARAQRVDVRGVRTVDELRARVRDFLVLHPQASTVTGRGWDQSLFPGGAYPTARDLAGLTDVPIVLRRVDGHAALVNDVVLKRAGLSAETRDPVGGQILRDESGAPSGVLVDNAMNLLDGVLPAPSDDEITTSLRAGLHACADAGLTSVHDMGMSPRSFRLLTELARRERLPVRVFVYLDAESPESLTLLDERPEAPRVALMGVKVLADGAMGSRGALLIDDYSDAPHHRGLAITDEKRLLEHVQQMEQRGAQVAIHAIGDLAVKRSLDAITSVGDSARSRHRIEHAQLVDPSDFMRFARAGVIASMQPAHVTSDMHWVLARIGPLRARSAYAWRTMRAGAVPLAFGSDAPVESERVTLGFFAALTRRHPSATADAPFFPEEKLFFSEALDAFTRGAAYAVRRDEGLGSLAPGFTFDASVFDADPRADPRVWLTVRPLETLVDGERRPCATRAEH
jgi:predicted amidohydrolase YtcJ